MLFVMKTWTHELQKKKKKKSEMGGGYKKNIA